MSGCEQGGFCQRSRVTRCWLPRADTAPLAAWGLAELCSRRECLSAVHLVEDFRVTLVDGRQTTSGGADV